MDYSSWGPQAIGKPVRKSLREVPAVQGMVIEDVETGFVGEIMRIEKSGGMLVLHLEGRGGKTRSFKAGYGFLLDGEPVRIIAPVKTTTLPPVTRSASGSVVVQGLKARTARASRILVEGKHDAELVEKVWGHDLRVEGIVVEPLHGVDDLAAVIADFAPSPQRRLGILVDHLVMGTKEQKIAERAMKVPGAAGNVLIVGHPYVDVWQAVKPSALGIPAWPVVPRGQDWKTGIVTAFGWPASTPEDLGLAWQRILSRVTNYADIEAALLGRVEEILDFLTEVDN
ncbi:DUF3097 domain-containing protein [Neomicrococcus lactis]|uniref:DUF3097 domain-containing protein n=1 Tax=Neomicrococcus lactis TaxID=732241 RepID=UPI002300A6C8|nr:DUF3097 domain-containing protein [Neomicrococcus lactis]